MKSKIIALALAVAMLALAAIGGSFAYFFDTDTQVNEFTIGNIKIDLFEDFNSEDLPLLPAVGNRDPQTGVTEMANTIEKEVYVENTGDQDAYVRVHIAVPAFTKDGASINVFSTSFDDQTTVDGKWIWGKTVDANYPPRDGGEWNLYRNVEINGVPYKVFAVTYETALSKGDITEDAIKAVYMDPSITQDDIAAWNEAYGEGVWNKIYVVAEGVQADGFADAVTALNAAFGVPGEYDVDFLADAEGLTFVEMTSNDGN